MFKSLVIALLGVAVVSVSSVEAQLFRRFAAPRPNYVQPAQQNYRNVPSGRYAVQPQPARVRVAQPQASQGQTYYRRVEVAPGRFTLVPLQPNVASQAQPTPAPAKTSAPQDIARQNTQQGSGVKSGTLSLEGPQTNSVSVVRTRPAPVAPKQVQQTQQRYRRVTVYNPRTGQRSTRLIPIPAATLAQQPYVYGQSGDTQRAPATQVVTGTLAPPAQSAQGASTANEIRLDTQVQPANFEEPSVGSNQPNLAAAISVSSPEPQPAIATSNVQAPTSSSVGGSDRQFSVLDFNDDASGSSGDEIGLELVAPAN